MTLPLRFITRTQLVRFRLKPSLTTSIPPPQTVTLLQFSTKTSATCLRNRSPANDAKPTGFTPPTVRPANPPAPKASVGSVRHPVTFMEELYRNVILLSCESTAEGGVCDVYLVGTSHDSKESRIQVGAMVDFLKPEAVFLELCLSRLKVIKEEEEKVDEISGKFEVFAVSEFGVAYEEAIKLAIKYGGRVMLGDRSLEESRIQVGAMVDFLKPEAVFLELCSSRVDALNEQEEKVDEISGKFEVFPYSEFGVAYEEAIKYGGRVILGDRPYEITLKRIWSNMPLWCKTLWFALHIPVVYPPSSNDLIKGGPFLISMSLFVDDSVLVHERDKFMSSTLLKVARKSRSVVVVVGERHLQGIKRNWKQPVVLEDLLTVPSPKLEIPARIIVFFVAMVGVSITLEPYLGRYL